MLVRPDGRSYEVQSVRAAPHSSSHPLHTSHSRDSFSYLPPPISPSPSNPLSTNIRKIWKTSISRNRIGQQAVASGHMRVMESPKHRKHTPKRRPIGTQMVGMTIHVTGTAFPRWISETCKIGNFSMTLQNPVL